MLFSEIIKFLLSETSFTNSMYPLECLNFCEITSSKVFLL